MTDNAELARAWEYKFLYLEGQYQQQAAALGKEGWEAIGHTGKSILFKRPLLIDGFPLGGSDG